jgi:hypothetical protein
MYFLSASQLGWEVDANRYPMPLVYSDEAGNEGTAAVSMRSESDTRSTHGQVSDA